MNDGFGRTWSSDHLTYILHQWRQCGTMEDNDTAESPKVTNVNPSLKFEVSRIPTSLAINNRFPNKVLGVVMALPQEVIRVSVRLLL